MDGVRRVGSQGSGREAFGVAGEHGGLAHVVEPQVQHGHPLQP